MISEAHRQQLQFKYGFPEALVQSLEESGEVSSLSPSEVRDHLGRGDIDSSGFRLQYPGNGASTIRLDTPLNGDKPQRYVRRAGEPNSLYIPSGLDLAQAQEMTAVCAAAGVKLMVAHVVRFFPDYAQAHRRVHRRIGQAGAAGVQLGRHHRQRQRRAEAGAGRAAGPPRAGAGCLQPVL